MRIAAASDLKGVWALAWRSLIYFPVALAISTLLLIAIVALLYLPIVAVVFLCFGLYSWAAGAIVLWLPVLWVWRRFRLKQFLISL